jgi:hypothetical protein
MAQFTLSQGRALPQGSKPWYDYWVSLHDHVIQNAADIVAQGTGSAPGWGAAIDTRWSVAETSSSSSAYTATVADASGEALFTGLHHWLYSIFAANTGAATYNIGTTDGAVAIKKIDSDGNYEDPAAGDMQPKRIANLFYDGTYWILLNPPFVEKTSVGFITKNADYNILSTDLDDINTLVVLAEPTADMTIKLPANSDYSGKTIIVKVNAAASSYVITTNDISSVEVHTAYAKGDFLKIASDGTDAEILDEYVTIAGLLVMTADDAIGASSKEKVYDTDYSEETDIGGWWDATTNHRFDIGFDCRMLINPNSLGSRLELSLNGFTIVNGTAVYAAADGTWQLDLSDGDYVEIYVNNPVASTVYLRGDAAKNESRVAWHVIRRIR